MANKLHSALSESKGGYQSDSLYRSNGKEEPKAKKQSTVDKIMNIFKGL